MEPLMMPKKSLAKVPWKSWRKSSTMPDPNWNLNRVASAAPTTKFRTKFVVSARRHWRFAGSSILRGRRRASPCEPSWPKSSLMHLTTPVPLLRKRPIRTKWPKRTKRSHISHGKSSVPTILGQSFFVLNLIFNYVRVSLYRKNKKYRYHRPHRCRQDHNHRTGAFLYRDFTQDR